MKMIRDEIKYVLDTIEKITNTSSSNEKIEILKESLSKPLSNVLYMVIKQTYDPRIKHNITSKGIDRLYISAYSEEPGSFLNLLLKLPRARSNEIKSNLITNHLLSSNELVLLKQIVDGQLKHANKSWGLSVKSINKVLKEHPLYDEIYQPKYMRCSTPSEKTLSKIVYPAVSQKKEDSEFCNVIVTDDTITFESRNGLPYKIDSISVDLMKSINRVIYNYVLNGELLLNDPTLSRTENRSKVSSYVKRYDTEDTILRRIEEAKTSKSKEKLENELEQKKKEWEETNSKLILSVWDMIPIDDYCSGKCELPYYGSKYTHSRLNDLKELITEIEPERVKMVDTKIVNNLEEAQEHFQEMLDAGYEGTILKSSTAIWKDGTSQEQIKFKSEKECELKIVGINPGNGEFSEGIGSYICESCDGKVKVNISGMKLHDRGLERVDENDSSKGVKLIDGFDLNEKVGSIITVRFNELIKAKGSETYSLYLPRIVAYRHDKNEADDLKYIKGL